MRCKPGDLAVVVNEGGLFYCQACGKRAFSNLLGRLCRVVTFGPLAAGELGTGGGYGWTLESRLPFSVDHCGVRLSGFMDAMGDDHLEPIRDRPGTDEMLLRTGKPKYFSEKIREIVREHRERLAKTTPTADQWRQANEEVLS